MTFFNKYRLTFYHLTFWLAYITLNILAGFLQSPRSYSTGILFFFFTYLPDIYAFYLCQYIFSRYAHPLKISWLVICLILAHSSYAFFWYLTGYYIRPFIWQGGPPPRTFHFFDFITLNIYKFIKYALLSFSFFYFRQCIKKEKELRMVEKEKFDTENAFLRAQINPHFLNSTLNFLHIKSLPLSKELANGIMTLSKIMCYSLKLDQNDRMTFINEEIEHIKNVININQLRFNHKLQIDFNIEGNTHNIKIIPLVLITIVENILKHGNCIDKENPVKILLTINEEGNISLNTFNNKKKGPKELSSGIGMINIKKRMMHHYAKNFTLNIDETESDYRLSLSIQNNLHQGKKQSSLLDRISFLEQLKLQPIEPKPYTS